MLKNLPRHYNPPGNGKRDMESLIYANPMEEALLRAHGGAGKMTKHGVRSYMIDGSYGSGFSDHTANGGTSGAGGNNSGGSSSGDRALGITTGSVTGTKAYGPAGGNAVGMGAPGYGTPAETAATLARLQPRVPVRQVAPIPPVKPPVPSVIPPNFMGPIGNVPGPVGPQIGGTNYADMMTAAINAGQPSTTPSATPGSSYGAPGGTSNPANSGGGGSDPSANYGNDQFGNTFGGGDMTRADVPGLSGTFDGGRRFGDQRTIGSPAQPAPAAPTAPTRSIGTTPTTMQRDPFSTYTRSPYENGPVMSPEQVVFKNYNKITDRIPPSSAALAGKVWSGSGGLRSRSPDPSRRGY